MNIMFIAPRVPKLEGAGYQALAFRRLEFLAKRHTLSVLCFRYSDDVPEDFSVIEEMGVAVHTVRYRSVFSVIGIASAILAFKLPFQCSVFLSPYFKAKLKEKLRSTSPDYVYCSTIRLMPYLVRYKGKVILEMVDSMGLNFSRRLSTARRYRKFVYWVEYLKVSRYERMLARLPNVNSFLVSKIDQDYIGDANISILPLGVDTGLKSLSARNPQNESIVFSGNMSYEPNIQAVIWFFENCWSDIQAQFPALQFFICGAKPVKNIGKLAAHPNIIVTGRVESVHDVLTQRTISIAPMQSGSGMQFKILEAMAAKIPVVATTLGCGVINTKHGFDIFVADTSKDFVDVICQLLSNPDLAHAVGEAGFRYVESKHSWDIINSEFSEINMI